MMTQNYSSSSEHSCTLVNKSKPGKNSFLSLNNYASLMATQENSRQFTGCLLLVFEGTQAKIFRSLNLRSKILRANAN